MKTAKLLENIDDCIYISGLVNKYMGSKPPVENDPLVKMITEEWETASKTHYIFVINWDDVESGKDLPRGLILKKS